jgi:CBS domain containing-hemolysin-like protein
MFTFMEKLGMTKQSAPIYLSILIIGMTLMGLIFAYTKEPALIGIMERLLALLVFSATGEPYSHNG